MSGRLETVDDGGEDDAEHDYIDALNSNGRKCVQCGWGLSAGQRKVHPGKCALQRKTAMQSARRNARRTPAEREWLERRRRR